MADDGAGINGGLPRELPGSLQGLLADADRMAESILAFMDCLNRQAATDEVLRSETNPSLIRALEADQQEIEEERVELWIGLDRAVRQYRHRVERLKASVSAVEYRCVAVPVRDLKRVEEARAAVWGLFPNASVDLIARLTQVMAPIWYIANRKFPVAVDPAG